jgi:hypothetical protein
MAMSNLFENHRLLLFYKGDISALVLFAQQENGGICFPEALPALSEILESEETEISEINLHPALLLKAINQHLDLDDDLLKIEPTFCERVDTPNGVITVYLARFTLLDPPHKLLESRHLKLKTLTELRRQSPAELELLRRAYVKVMEG